ncbi:MAG TPA: hypothetical protein VF517_12585 [Thermoleophilaceae bacterium]
MRRLLALPLLVAAAVTGCGGGGDDDKPKTPKAAETIQQFQARLTTAVAAIGQGQCETVTQFNSKAGFQLPCDERSKKLFAGFRVTGAKTYGSGGVVEFQDAETKGKFGVYTVAVGEDGKYQITGPISPIVEKSTLTEKADKAEEMDKSAQAMVDAIRSNNCDKFFGAVITPPGMPKPQACKQELGEAYGPLRQQLAADKDAKPERLDGNAGFMFYALEAGGQYRTLIVTRTEGAAKPYLGFVTFRGPAEKKT